MCLPWVCPEQAHKLSSLLRNDEDAIRFFLAPLVSAGQREHAPITVNIRRFLSRPAVFIPGAGFPFGKSIFSRSEAYSVLSSDSERNVSHNEKAISVGVIGATGMVGQRFVTLLEDHPWFQVTALAAICPVGGQDLRSRRSAGRWAMPTPIPDAGAQDDRPGR